LLIRTRHRLPAAKNKATTQKSEVALLSLCHSLYRVIGNNQSIGQMIKQARISAGLTQKELAEKLGISEAAISNLERRTTPPSVSTLEKVAAATGKKLVIVLV
jgi:DNA-binding XRE family transcriptional regulator